MPSIPVASTNPIYNQSNYRFRLSIRWRLPWPACGVLLVCCCFLLLLLHVSCHVIDVLTISVDVASLHVCFILVAAGNSARLIMCCLAVMPVTVASTINVDRVCEQWQGLFTFFYWQVKLVNWELFWQLLGVCYCRFRETSCRIWYCRICSLVACFAYSLTL